MITFGVIISEVKQAVDRLNHSELVAIPTETVYGMAAKLSDPAAVQKVFSVKKRPSFDPLIVHVRDMEMARPLFKTWTQTQEKLAESFWPGALTMVAEKAESVSDAVTAGLPTVAVRWANHPVLQSLLDELGEPLVAPSANLFGKTSPTSAAHVEEEFPELTIVEGGECQVGIESTVVRTDSDPLEILRPGLISASALAVVCGQEVISVKKPIAPGHLENHYQPKKPLFVVESGVDQLTLPEQYSELKMGTELKLDPDPKNAARELYSKLREFDKSMADYTYIVRHEEMSDSLWQAIWDRLEKASSATIS